MSVSGMNVSHATEEQGSQDEVETVKRKWGASIRRQRLYLGMTQVQLAKAVAVDQSAVSAWESGRKAPTIERQLAIANALRIDARVLFEFPQQVA